MDSFKSILVDIDSLAAAHPALDRACDLARRCNARLKIVDTVHVPVGADRYLPQGAEPRIVNARRQQLEKLAASVEGVITEFDVLRGRPALALIQEVLKCGHDLLVRSHARDVAALDKIFGAVDMELFRQCPCPVWAIGPGLQTDPRKILAAVHANREDEAEQKLNRKIIELSLLMARLENSALILFQGWSAFGEEILRSHCTPEELAAYVGAAEAAATADLEALVNSFGERLTNARVALRKGEPEQIIPQLVLSEGIDLVVMGTVSRSGIAGLVIGNTAERLLQRLLCSVLAVKPDGFVSAVHF